MMENTSLNEILDPFALTDEEGYMWVKGNLHSHTTNSDGRATPQQRLDGYVDQGYDYMCLSDHHRITWIDSVQCPENFALIQGAELHPDNPFGGKGHHFVCLNLTQDIDAKSMPPQHVIDYVNEQGGAVFLAHPHWSSVNIVRDTLPLHGFAGIEVFNTTCRCNGRGESSVHWDDWMEQDDRLYTVLANDDSHALGDEQHDTYQGWTWALVREKTADAVVKALVMGASYASNGPVIQDIVLRRLDEPGSERPLVEATIKCSEARRISAVADSTGVEYRLKDNNTFVEATFMLRANARWTRFEIIGADGLKAWSNPFDLSKVKRA